MRSPCTPWASAQVTLLWGLSFPISKMEVMTDTPQACWWGYDLMKTQHRHTAILLLLSLFSG